MDKQIIVSLKVRFDDLAHKDEETGIEFWYARELQPALGYAKWENFETAIKRAMVSCETAKIEVSKHFPEVRKTIEMPNGAEKQIVDYMLTRYACYLIAQNGDPRKDEIAFAQSYFALQTRKQELIEDRINLLRRMEAREKLTASETLLSKNIYERGVDDKGFGRIRSAGDEALFTKSTAAMKKQLGVKDSRPLADFLPTVTIAAKNLATEMTNHNTEEKDLRGEYSIKGEHVSNNKAVREILTKRGIYPEKLPPAEDIKKLQRRVNSEEKKLAKDKGFLSRKKKP